MVEYGEFHHPHEPSSNSASPSYTRDVVISQTSHPFRHNVRSYIDYTVSLFARVSRIAEGKQSNDFLPAHGTTRSVFSLIPGTHPPFLTGAALLQNSRAFLEKKIVRFVGQQVNEIASGIVH